MYGHPITTTLTILLQKIYCISHTTDSTWVENEIICGCARTCLRMSKGVFRRSSLQAPDHWFVKPAFLLSVFFWILTVCSKSRICFGEMYWSESIHFNRKCSGVKVKVGWNIKTHLKYRCSQKIILKCCKQSIITSLQYTTEIYCNKNMPGHVLNQCFSTTYLAPPSCTAGIIITVLQNQLGVVFWPVKCSCNEFSAKWPVKICKFQMTDAKNNFLDHIHKQ